MGRIGKWFWHIVVGMVRGCAVFAIGAAILVAAVTLIATHRLPTGFSLTLMIFIVILAGLLGAVISLAWRLSHIGEIVHVTKDLAEHAKQDL